MRIAILVDTLRVGGAERQAVVCVSELRKLGHAVDLIYYHPMNGYGEMLQKLQVRPICLQAASARHRLLEFRRLFKEKAYDVVHGFKMSAEIYAAISGSWAGVPRRFGSFRTTYDLGLRYRILHYGVDKLLNGWIVNSEAAADSMARSTHIRRSKISILRNGVCLDLIRATLSPSEAKVRLGVPADSTVITMVARLHPEKNHRMFLEVAREIVHHVPKAHFLVVGEGDIRPELEQLARELGVTRNVTFLGIRSDIAEILAATDITAHTSNHEGLPNVIIEAMSAGKPVVCTNFTGSSEIMVHGENALLSPCRETRPFAANVLALIKSPERRQQLAEKGFEYARARFSSEVMARNLEAIYLGKVRPEPQPNQALPREVSFAR